MDVARHAAHVAMRAIEWATWREGQCDYPKGLNPEERALLAALRVLREERCIHEHSNLGPRCALENGHDGSHHFKCCAKSCPGYAFPASEQRHPCKD
jgi:hypothetical protein